MTPSRRLLITTGFTISSGALGFAISEWIERRTIATSGATLPLRGIPGIGGPVRLTDHRRVRVDETTFQGKIQLVFFGFTSCPDVCPTALNLISDLLDRLGPDAAAFQPLFITVDPERDTTEVMARYVEAFHPSIVGLTGTVEEIEGVASAFRAYFKKVPSQSGLGYVMDHTATIYVLDRQGVFRATLDIHESPDTSLEVLRRFTAPARGS
ncbi:MAG: SCO family protein [Alphaproteobacteria bacterium]|nr:SCO family protein [Alphaproteobacteria bacterium]